MAARRGSVAAASRALPVSAPRRRSGSRDERSACILRAARRGALTGRPRAQQRGGVRSRSTSVLQAVLPTSVLIGRVPLARDDRRVALSFDDGPDEMTPRYLDALDALGISATFFLLGAQCARFPEHVLEMVRRGHELASHGFSHRHLPDMSFDELRSELSRTHDFLPPTPRRPMVRPPRGAISARSILRCTRLGYATAMWSVDSQDYREKDPERVAQAALPDDVRAGDVILLHEGQSWTLDALPSIRRRAQERGFELCTMGALLDGARAR